MTVVEVQDLRFGIKRHFWSKRREILRGVTFTVDAGEVFGFLGPNGAGKTTTIKSILGLLRPQAGKVRIFDRKNSDLGVRRRVGFMPERADYPEHLAAQEFLLQHGLLAGLRYRDAKRRTQEVLSQVGLSRRARQRLGGYSKGMLQRVGVAQAIIGHPDLVILDEPLSGLDPIGRRDIREIMLQLQQQGKTVFFSTHILPDVEMICDRVAILVQGRVKKIGHIHKLAEGAIKRIEITAEHVNEATLNKAREISHQLSQHEDEYSFHVQDDDEAGRLIDLLRAGGAVIRYVDTQRESLEDAFVKVTREEGEAA